MEPLLNFIFRGAKTKRFHTTDTLTSQTVGEHSFGVAWLVVLISPTCRKELILAALAHDLAEHRVGDVSSPVKRANPTLKSALDVLEARELGAAGLEYETGLSDAEALILKTADILDGLMFCIRERRMGSRVVNEVYHNFADYFLQLAGLPDRATELFETIQQQWEEVNVS